MSAAYNWSKTKSTISKLFGKVQAPGVFASVL